MPTMVEVLEQVGAACASTAMCYLMHLVAVASVAAKASEAQVRDWAPSWATGRRWATLAFSEPGTGAHFYRAEMQPEAADGGWVLQGTKSFVTSGAFADDYVVLTRSANPSSGLDVWVVPRTAPGVSFGGEWTGIGMAGNASVEMRLDRVPVRPDQRVGGEGAGEGIVFEVVAPYFLLGVAAVNVGIAKAAVEAARAHMQGRQHSHTHQALAEYPTLQTAVAELDVAVRSGQAVVREAAQRAASGAEDALLWVMAAKVHATDTAARVSDAALGLGGGRAYARRSPLERHWRDGHAGRIMAPTNATLLEWIGRTRLGLPLFA